MKKKKKKQERIIVIGKQEQVGSMVQEMLQKDHNPMVIQQYMNPSAHILLEAIQSPRERPEILLIADPRLGRSVEQEIDQARKAGVKIEYLPNLVERRLRRIPLDLIDQFRDYYDVVLCQKKPSRIERVFDVGISFFALVFLSPLILGIALGILLTSGRPVIFAQKRAGVFGELFTFYKFRSLTTPNSPAESEDPNCAISSRSNAFGRWIRKTRIDEIPQFWNVLTGKMAFIGPRPEMVYYHQMCVEQIPFYQYRFRVKPGITGWAQVSYKHTTTLDEYKRKTEYDLYSIKNRNARLSALILIKTIITMLGMRGK
jgi:lipopolysaccharide/colanic/teichoic acid biosynthesis glycosyltransferase